MNNLAVKKTMLVLVPALITAALVAFFYTKLPQKKAPGPELTEVAPTVFVSEVQNEPEISEKAGNESGEEAPGTLHETDAPQSAEDEVKPMEELASLSVDETWRNFLNGDFIKNIIIFLDEVGLGVIPRKSLGYLMSPVKFTGVYQNGKWYVSSESCNRYNHIVQVFCSIDPEEAARIFKRIRPFLDAQLLQLGYSNLTLEQLALNALNVLRNTPVPGKNEILLRLDENLFQWENADLEALSPVQKCLLRLGPDNLDRLKKHADKLILATEL